MGRYGQPEGGHGQVWSGMVRYGQPEDSSFQVW